MQELVQSVERALSILEVLADYEDGIGIAEISEKAGLHKSTVYRLINTLIHKNYVEQNQDTSKYFLTLKLFELGSRKIGKIDLAPTAKPYLKELVEKTGEVVHLVVREKNRIVYIDKIEPEKSIMMYTRIGMSKPMYCTAMGKAIMAELEDDEVAKIWNESDKKVYTENTIVKLEELKENLKDVRLKGYAIDNQEVEKGIICLGAVIKNYDGSICGAISVSGSIITLTDEKIEYVSEQLVKCAKDISKKLGYKY